MQYAADECVQLLEKHQIKLSMSQKGKPDQNGYAERVIRTIEEEEVELSEYAGYWDAKARIGEFIEEVYQEKRIHSALGYLTPAEFEEKWRRERETVASLSKNGQKTVQLLGSTTRPCTTVLQGDGTTYAYSHGSGEEYGGRADRHDYELYLALNDIDHTKTKTRSPQTNGICEQFRKTIYPCLEELQKDLDHWMERYNNERVHQGKRCQGGRRWRRSGRTLSWQRRRSGV